VARLTKRDTEVLMDAVDRDPLAVLTQMLGKVLDRPGEGWDALVAGGACPAERAARLLARDRDALDELAAELNELRGLEHDRS
jgi:hypothetical protein